MVLRNLKGPLAPLVVVCLLTSFGCGSGKAKKRSSTTAPITSGAQLTVTPGDGPDVGTNTVEVALSGFSGAFVVGQDEVLFGSTPLTGVALVNTGVVSGIAPAGSGTVDVTVNLGNQSETLSAGYTYHAAEVVSVDPPQGAPGTTVEVQVAWFAQDFTQTLPEVRFGGSLVSATALGPDRLSCTVPAGAGAVDVEVSAASPAQQATLAAGFSYSGGVAAELVAGPRNPAQVNAQAPSAGLVLAQARLRAHAGLTVDELTVRAEGSLDESVGAGDVLLYHDLNSDGLLQASDVQLGAGAAFAANNGTVTFSGLNLQLAAGTNADLLVTGELLAAAEVGRTVVVRVLGRDVVASVPVSGGVQGAELRVVNADPPRELTVSGPTAAAPLIGVPADGVDVAAFSAQLSSPVPPLTCHGVTLRASGTADDVRDVIEVTLLVDTNGDGQRDAGDTVLGRRPFAEDDGTISFPINQRLTSTGTTIDLLAVVSFRGTAANNATFQLELDGARGLVAHAYTTFGGCQVNAPALPIVGPSLGLSAAAGLGLRAVRQAPQLAAPQAEVVALRLEAQAGSSAATVDALTVNARGSLDDAAEIAGVTLYHDQNGNGAIDAGDPVLSASGQFAADDGALTLTLTTPRQLAAAASETWLVGVELASGATSGSSVSLSLDPATAQANVAVNGEVQSGGLVLVSSDQLAFVQPGAAEGKDAYLRGEGLYLNDNFGYTASLAVGDRPSGQLGERLFYVEFPLPALPANAAPKRAYAAFYLLGTGGLVGTSLDVQAFQVIPSGARTPWCEGTGGFDSSGDGICYDGTIQGMNRPDLSHPDVNPTALTEQTIAAGSEGRWVLFDVTAAVQSWYAGSPNHGLRFRDKALTNTEGAVGFASSEWGVGSQRPILIVEH